MFKSIFAACVLIACGGSADRHPYWFNRNRNDILSGSFDCLCPEYPQRNTSGNRYGHRI